MKTSTMLPTTRLTRLARLSVLGLLATAGAARAELVHRWSFNESAGAAAAGTTLNDTISSQPLTVEGQGASFSGLPDGQITLPGAGNGNQPESTIPAYLNLPNGILSSRTDISIEFWATPLSSNAWQRAFDFGSMAGAGDGLGAPGEWTGALATAPGFTTASDEFALTLNVADNINEQRLYGRLDYDQNNNPNFYLSNLPTTPGDPHHYVVTFEDGVGSFGGTGGRQSWYRDGSLVGFQDLPYHLSDVDDVNNWIGRSQFAGDELAHLSLDEFRIHDHVVTIEEIAANIAAGPDTLVDPPDPVDPPAPDHLWTFTVQADSAAESGSVFTDEVGGSWEAVLRGNGGALTGTSVSLPGTTTGNQNAANISAYLDLSNGIVSDSASVSFEAWATPLSSKTWQRLFDFGRCTQTSGPGAVTGEIIDGPAAPGPTDAWDNLSLTFNRADDINQQQLEGEYDNNEPPKMSFSTAATIPGTEYHYVLIVEDGVGDFGAAGCRASWYRNGILQNSDDFNFRLVDMEDVNNWIGRSMYSGDSNSHMELNELRIHRRAISPAEVFASFAAGPDPSSGPPEPPAPAPVPTHRWDFITPPGDAPVETSFIDVVSGEVATVRGHGATLDGDQLTLGAGGVTNGNTDAAGISSYLDLRNGLISGFDNLTVEGWITPLSSNFWQRVWDFGSSTLTHGTGAEIGEILDEGGAPGGFEGSDVLFLSMNNGNNFGNQRIGGRLDYGGETYLDTDLSGITSAGTEYHFVMTVEDGEGTFGASGCQVRWYRDSVLQKTLSLPYRLADMDDVNNWIGRSNWAGDSNSHLAINELRIYDRAITQREINTTYDLGPDATFSPPVAGDDAATLHAGQKVLIDILANDTNSPDPATVALDTLPAGGTAEVQADGRILYTHAGGASVPDSFTYTVDNFSGTSDPATVELTLSTALRIDNPSLAMPADLPPTTWTLEDALPGLTFSRPVCLAGVPGDANQLYVCQQAGIIRRVADVTSPTPSTNVFLDLDAAGTGVDLGPFLAGQPENGLLGLAFHPDYASNGHFFVAYTVNDGGNYFQRISRFTRDASDPTIADPSTELVLLHVDDFGLNHNGGDLHFGPFDGYLYYGSGDGENSTRGQERSQIIDGDFYSGIFRMDVDKLPGSLEPNPHPSIPVDGTTGLAAFSVPVDNPFVHTSLGGDWDGIYNGDDYSGSLGTVRTEYWATGIRHAWRMSFDPLTGDLWEGDVGQVTYEEINKIERGGEYGWAYREGAHDFSGILGGAPAGWTSSDPFYEYVHTAVAGGDAKFKGNSVCGGYVYRGSRYPSLYGSYIFCDSTSGHVWQMDTTTAAVERITGLPGAYGVFSSMGVDPSNQDILFCSYLDGRILRLARGGEDTGSFPQTLSETGLFSDLADLSPAPGLLPYQPNLKFWSDHADKRRWFAIPDDTSRMTWKPEGGWDYPAGMLWVKHFDLSLTRGDPATHKRLETRVLVKKGDGSAYGVSYRWNEEGTEAFLVPADGVAFELPIIDAGSPHTQTWEIPGRSSCLTCHGDRPLSMTTRQLNRVHEVNGFTGNQIELISSGGYLTNTPDPVETLPYHVASDDLSQPLEQRVRSYLEVNCAYCHQEGGSVGGFWDGREELSLEETGIINGEPVVNGGDPLNKYIVPMDTGHSLLLHRMAATGGTTRMPPLATAEIDEEAVQLVTDWINSGLPADRVYPDWAAGYPGLGGRDDDDDGDGKSNYEEFVLGTDPLAGDDAPVGTATMDGFEFVRQPFRIYDIQTSSNLLDWDSWPGPENTPGYGTSPMLETIPYDLANDDWLFFRVQVEEP